jgi:hypothetical protein
MQRVADPRTPAGISDSLLGVSTLRDRIEHLPTWPSPPQVFRGFLFRVAPAGRRLRADPGGLELLT